MPPTQDSQQSTSQPEAPLPSARRFSKKIIIGVGAIVIIIAAGLFVVLSHFGQPPNTASVKNSLAINFQTNTTPVQYGGKDAIQACSLLPQGNLAKAGYKLDSGSGTDVFSRTYFTGEGTTSMKLGVLGFNVIGGPYFNTCSYLLADGLRLTAIIVQPSYIESGSFSIYVSKQNPTTVPAINGVKIWTYHDPTLDLTDYALTAPDSQSAVQFSVESEVRNQDPAILTKAEQAILPVVANNLVAQSKKATGSPTLTYDHNAFPVTFAKACSLTNNNDFQKIFGSEEAPLVTENGGSPGTTAINGVQATFVDNQCLIQSYVNVDDYIINPTPDFSIPDVHYLTVNAESYLTDQAAQAGFVGAKQASHTVTAANGIGDEAFFASQGGGLENPLILRKGRFIVELSPSQIGVPSSQSAAQIITQLTPLGQKVAGELK